MSHLTSLTPSAQCIRCMITTFSDECIDETDLRRFYTNLKGHGLYYVLKYLSIENRLTKTHIEPKTIFNMNLPIDLEFEYDKMLIEYKLEDLFNSYAVIKKEICNEWKQNILTNREKESMLGCNCILELPNDIITQIGEYI